MPEGHLVHWLARRQTSLLAGRRVEVTSPQGRFREGAARLDGAVLRRVEAVGKHLLYHWEDREMLHVHLGQGGKFLEGAPVQPPVPQARLRLVGNGVALQLVAPTVCELLDPSGVASLRARLGPDPLRDDADPERVWQAVARSRRSIGALLLDQSVVAGVGNVLRAEALNLARIHPETPGHRLGRRRFARLWAEVTRIMVEASERGRIVTVPGAAGDAEGRFVYRRDRCARCGTAVQTWVLAARTMYACPRCQRRLASVSHPDS